MLVIIEDFKILFIVNEDSLSFIMLLYNNINIIIFIRVLVKFFS